jgi:hypothetical protein
MIERGNTWQAGNKWRAASFHLVLRSPKDVLVMQNPPGWTMPEDSLVLGAFGAVALGALGWVAVLKRKIRQQAKA